MEQGWLYLFLARCHPRGSAVALSEAAGPPQYRSSRLPGKHDAFSTSVGCWWVISAGSQPACPQLCKWVRELQKSKTSEGPPGWPGVLGGGSLHQGSRRSLGSRLRSWGLPWGGSVVKNLLADAGDTGSIPDRERFFMPRSN